MSNPVPVTVSDARNQLSTIVTQAREAHEPVYLFKHGRRVAAIIDADDLDRLIELSEEASDLRAVREAREEMRMTGAEPIPWESVKADLGLI